MEKVYPRAKFDQQNEFVAQRNFEFGAHTISAGQRFDKSLCPPRRLRQLYEARYLRMATAEELTPKRSRPRLGSAA